MEEHPFLTTTAVQYRKDLATEGTTVHSMEAHQALTPEVARNIILHNNIQGIQVQIMEGHGNQNLQLHLKTSILSRNKRQMCNLRVSRDFTRIEEQSPIIITLLIVLINNKSPQPQLAELLFMIKSNRVALTNRVTLNKQGKCFTNRGRYPGSRMRTFGLRFIEMRLL